MILLELLIAVPFLGALLSMFLPKLQGKLVVLVSVAALHAALTLIVVTSGDRYGEVFGTDEIGRLLLLLTSLVNVPCSLAAVDYVRSGRRAKSDSYVPCHLAFLGALTMALSTLHLGVFWVAIEATTLATAPLILYNHRSRESLEATWKYLVLCSVGIALALLGTFCMAIALSSTISDTLGCACLTGHALRGPKRQCRPAMAADGVHSHADRLWHENGSRAHAFLDA